MDVFAEGGKLVEKDGEIVSGKDLFSIKTGEGGLACRWAFLTKNRYFLLRFTPFLVHL